MSIQPASLSERIGDTPEQLAAAAAAGRRLAAQSVVEDLAPDMEPVEAMARAGLVSLRHMGIDAEIVRSRRELLVVRSAARTLAAAAPACALVSAWLEALPGVVHGRAGTVAESTCSARGGRSCIHTLMWRGDTNGARPMPPIRLEALPAPPVPLLPGPAVMPGGAPPPPPGYRFMGDDWASPRVPGTAPSAVNGTTSPNARTGPATPDPWSVDAAHAPTLTPPWPSAPEGVPAVHDDPAASPGHSSRRPRRDSDPRPATVTDQRGQDGPSERPGRAHWAWARRRAWFLVVGLVAGSLGGFYASRHASSDYSATTVMVAQAPASTAAAATANGAEELAVTYAALIPDDQALVHRIAAALDTSSAQVASRLSVEAVAGTSLIDVKFTGATSAGAEAGANDVARALAGTDPPGRAVATGSVSIVSSAQSAARSGTLHKYGLPLGLLLGLVVGAGTALVAERTDRRIDDLDALGAAAGCSATRSPGGISTPELARALDNAGSESVTVVPLRAGDRTAATELATALDRARRPGASSEGPSNARAVPSPPFATGPGGLSQGTGGTVLVVAPGERVAAVQEACERLRLLGRDPLWAVLVTGGRKRTADDRAG